MEGAVLGVEVVRTFGGVVARKYPLLAPLAAGNVDSPALHEMASKPDAKAFVFQRAACEARIEQAQQPVESRFIAAVRGRGQQNACDARRPRQVAATARNAAAGPVRADAGMGLVHHHQAGTCAGKALASLISLDVIEADDREGMGVEKCLRSREASLKPSSRGGRDGDCVQVEFA